MKRIFNRLALLGVDFIQYMGAHYDFMPGYNSIAMTNNWQNPLFRHYHELSRYISAIQYLVAKGTYITRTLLFYPLTSTRAILGPQPTETLPETPGDLTIGGLVNGLLNLNVPFEMVFEQVLEECEIENGAFVIANQAYHTIILPYTPSYW